MPARGSPEEILKVLSLGCRVLYIELERSRVVITLQKCMNMWPIGMLINKWPFNWSAGKTTLVERLIPVLPWLLHPS